MSKVNKAAKELRTNIRTLVFGHCDEAILRLLSAALKEERDRCEKVRPPDWIAEHGCKVVKDAMNSFAIQDRHGGELISIVDADGDKPAYLQSIADIITAAIRRGR